MRVFLLGILFLFDASNPNARATDIDYDLSIKHIDELSEEKVASPFSIDVKDRVWIYGGIEEGTEPAKLHVVPSGATQHVRLEPSPEAVHVSYLVDFSEPAVRAPDWIDDGLWPRTKEVLHYGNEPRPSPPEPVKVLYFGRIGMTR